MKLATLRTGAIIAAGFALVACNQFENQKRAERAQSELIGMSRSEIVECAGRPDRTVGSGGMEMLIYLYGEQRRMVGEPDVQSTVPQTAPPSANSTPWCEATITLENSRVTNVRYRGQTGGLITGSQNVCGEIVYHCVRQSN